MSWVIGIVLTLLYIVIAGMLYELNPLEINDWDDTSRNITSSLWIVVYPLVAMLFIICAVITLPVMFGKYLGTLVARGYKSLRLKLDTRKERNRIKEYKRILKR